jgi:hypothetical protein
MSLSDKLAACGPSTNKRVAHALSRNASNIYERRIRPNENELSYRWRERAWIALDVFSYSEAGRRCGQRLAAAIGYTSSVTSGTAHETCDQIYDRAPKERDDHGAPRRDVKWLIMIGKRKSGRV